MDNQRETLDQFQHLLDVPLSLRVELDQRLMTFGELMELNVGSLIKLARPTGENIDIYTGDVLIGWGEILLVDGNMTVRIADLKGGSVLDAPARAGRHA
jgi:flagellar motor switch protein FliN